ncbi:MAG: thiol-disulfide isomerase [Gammaproteobacteria bacterium]|nr:thiol-disulfide isomerase [Gammaproteobacteria bacterium]MBU0883195.1 thiol-disulfide isomerase [Gammaproteobacteria bacterium]MBU0902098.1 thiol-disulfide isomerase [Gammaproteobacteria bacterium]MBU1860218.1 thiol-disulfide isomerase [Gammaproteobacteria bacterium]
MTLPSRNTLLASLLILLWAAAMLVAYWWYEARYLRSFSDQTALFYGEQLRLPDELAGPGPIRLVHFWDPTCPCNIGNQQHLADLTERFGPQGVSFYAVQKPNTKGQLPSTLSALQPLAALPGSDQIPASPAVAVWDRNGQLAYFGPYSEGATCTSSNSFIEPILDALIEGRAVNASNTLALGCFCDWQDN